MSFQAYYAALLRRSVRTVPTAADARRDYRQALEQLTHIGLVA